MLVATDPLTQMELMRKRQMLLHRMNEVDGTCFPFEVFCAATESHKSRVNQCTRLNEHCRTATSV